MVLLQEEQVEQNPYQLLTSTRYDPLLQSLSWNNDPYGPSPFFLLPLHFERLLSAAETHNWLYAKSLLKYNYLKSYCSDAISEQRVRGHTSTSFRLRITVSVEGRIVVTATPLPEPFRSDPTSLSLSKPPPPIPDSDTPVGSALRIYVDKEAIDPSVFTQTKTTLRDIYEHAKARNERPPPNEAIEDPPAPAAGWDVLLYNRDGEIMETSIFNVAFYRDSEWLTPSSNSGCLPGVMRKWLLDNGRSRRTQGEY
ncbi:aminotransferase [Flammula alnicola]|nr:aminotransferase [Flammula alnicola]